MELSNLVFLLTEGKVAVKLISVRFEFIVIRIETVT